MASFQKTARGWRAQLCVLGLRKSATFATKAEAQEWSLAEEPKLRDLVRREGYSRSVPKSRRQSVQLMKLLSSEDIISRSELVSMSSGVYFLIKDGIVVYVGQSIDVFARLATHRRDKKFDRVTIIWCPPEILLKLEAKYIARLRPELNRSGYNNRYAIKEGVDGINC